MLMTFVLSINNVLILSRLRFFFNGSLHVRERFRHEAMIDISILLKNC